MLKQEYRKKYSPAEGQGKLTHLHDNLTSFATL